MKKADIRKQWEGAAPGWAKWEATVATVGARPFKKSHPLQYRTSTAKFEFIAEHRAEFGVAFLCRRYRVSRSGLYAWRNDEELGARIERIIATAVSATARPECTRFCAARAAFAAATSGSRA